MSSTAELFLSYWIILCKTAWYEHNYKNVEKQQIVSLYDNETFQLIMWKSRLENLYFLGPLYFILQFQGMIQ